MGEERFWGPGAARHFGPSETAGAPVPPGSWGNVSYPQRPAKPGVQDPPHPVGVGGGFFLVPVTWDPTKRRAHQPHPRWRQCNWRRGTRRNEGRRPPTWRTEAPSLCRGVRASEQRAEQRRSFWRWQRTRQRKKRKKSLPPFTLPCAARAYYRASQCPASTCRPPSSRSTALVVDPFSPCFIHLSKAS